jgi:hypothetical protein
VVGYLLKKKYFLSIKNKLFTFLFFSLCFVYGFKIKGGEDSIQLNGSASLKQNFTEEELEKQKLMEEYKEELVKVILKKFSNSNSHGDKIHMCIYFFVEIRFKRTFQRYG